MKALFLILACVAIGAWWRIMQNIFGPGAGEGKD